MYIAGGTAPEAISRRAPISSPILRVFRNPSARVADSSSV
jgi:hypothetical protein